jgi:hypothetical protein
MSSRRELGGRESRSAIFDETCDSGNRFEEIEVNSNCQGSYFSFFLAGPPLRRSSSCSSSSSSELEST